MKIKVTSREEAQEIIEDIFRQAVGDFEEMIESAFDTWVRIVGQNVEYEEDELEDQQKFASYIVNHFQYASELKFAIDNMSDAITENFEIEEEEDNDES